MSKETARKTEVEEFNEEEAFAISSELEELISVIAEEETLEECVAFEMIGEDI